MQGCELRVPIHHQNSACIFSTSTCLRVLFDSDIEDKGDFVTSSNTTKYKSYTHAMTR